MIGFQAVGVGHRLIWSSSWTSQAVYAPPQLRENEGVRPRPRRSGSTSAPTPSRVGVMKYSSGANTEFNLNSYYDKNAMKTRIMAISYNGGGTNTGDS